MTADPVSMPVDVNRTQACCRTVIRSCSSTG